MQPISLSKTQDVISHLIAGDSYRMIEMATGVSKSIIAEWNEIKKEECQKLIESMPRRLEAVIMAKGGHTKY